MSRLLLPLEEINNLKTDIEQNLIGEDFETDTDLILDLVEDVLILSYIMGKNQAENDLGFEGEEDLDHLSKTLNRKIDSQTYRERVERYVAEKDIPSIERVINAESHRLYCEGSYHTALLGGAKRKTWHTMMDERVRDPHAYLEGMTKNMGELFYTYNGDSALEPGGFNEPSEDINCRCWLSYE